MINAISDGGNTAGLLQYLVGRGRANEHTSPHLVAGSDVIMRRWGAWDRLSAAQGFEQHDGARLWQRARQKLTAGAPARMDGMDTVRSCAVCLFLPLLPQEFLHA